jgi:putative membrane protein
VIVDIDNDISEVLGVSIVRGEDDVLKAALTYSQERPEDADLNAIFTGLSLYRKLKSRGRDVDVVIVGGDRRDIVEAQVRVKERVREVVKSYDVPVELYIVGDGLDEIMVAEVLGDVAPIAAVKRVIVEQHAGVETSYP